jgi:hypothetical protein
MKVLDARDLPPKERHPEITEAFESLDSGESLTLVNDHDPKPLYYEMEAERDAFDADERVDPHTHPERQVVLCLRQGQIELNLDDETHSLEAGDVIR